MASDPALQAFLQQQRADYRAGLPERLAQLDRAWTAWTQAPGTETLQPLERCAHGLAGSAATFGLPRLGELAQALEEVCEQPGPALAEARQALREALQREIAAAA